LNSEGNEAFKKKDYPTAVKKYSEAIELDEKNHVFYSNRSAAFAGMNQFEEAAKDAAKCIELNPNFVKGYHRYGLALSHLHQYAEALATLKAGQKVDFNNKDLNKLISEVR
jgi:stress-induced-phosphoprotein 1